MTQLKISNLRKTYRNRLVVKDVSLTVKKGEVVGLLGPNGAGKTTVFYMIVGLIAPNAGSVKLNHSDITHVAMHQRCHMGLAYLPQESSIFRKLTVEDNILGILELRDDLTPQAQHEKCAELIKELHLYAIRDSLGISLSGGERRRVEIARTLALDPQFILLDEPFAGIDPISIQELKVTINLLKETGIGILITDHNFRDTLAICDRACIINQGKVIAHGEPKAIIQNEEVQNVYLGKDANVFVKDN